MGARAQVKIKTSPKKVYICTHIGEQKVQNKMLLGHQQKDGDGLIQGILQELYLKKWLTYRNTDKKLSTCERLTEAMEKNNCVWQITKNGKTVKINYWEKILKINIRS